MDDDPGADVLRRFVQGDLEAFETLFRQFEIEAYRWILRIVREPGAAEDVLVETFWRAYRGRARFDPSRSFGAWLRCIATNASRDRLKRSRRLVEPVPPDEETPAAATSDRWLREAIARAFRRLPVKLRVVATLALIENRSYAEIGDALGLPIGTVKSRAFRAMRAMRKDLARQGIQP